MPELNPRAPYDFSKLSLHQLHRLFPTDHACLEYIMNLKYSDKRGRCPKCHRETKFSKVSSRKSYSCNLCGWHYSPMADTMFRKTALPLTSWFYALWFIGRNPDAYGIGAALSRGLGIKQSSVWRMTEIVQEYLRPGYRERRKKDQGFYKTTNGTYRVRIKKNRNQIEVGSYRNIENARKAYTLASKVVGSL